MSKFIIPKTPPKNKIIEFFRKKGLGKLIELSRSSKKGNEMV